MHTLRNRHKGEAAFLIGSGPSLLQTAGLERLDGRVTFACSRLKLWKDRPFTPLYQVLSDRPHVDDPITPPSFWEIEGVRERFIVYQREIKAPGFTWIPKMPNEYYMSVHGARGLEEEFQPFTNGRTAVLCALQLALWMGCDPLYVVGNELTFRGHVWDVADTSIDHGVERHVAQFKRAAEDMKAAGRTLIDCTPSGNLSRLGALEYRDLAGVLERQDLADVLGGRY